MPFYLEETPDTKVQFVGVANNDSEIQKLQKQIEELTAKLAQEDPFAKERADYERQLASLKDQKPKVNLFLFKIVTFRRESS